MPEAKDQAGRDALKRRAQGYADAPCAPEAHPKKSGTPACWSTDWTIAANMQQCMIALFL